MVMTMEDGCERHPLQPFLPQHARLLMLGSFPPPRKRWSMDFYYPNFNNDMWRVVGHLFFGDRNRFVDLKNKRFCHNDIETFLRDKGIALFDAATVVKRLQGNASDKFLEIVEPTDIRKLLSQLPECKAIVSTGEKSVQTLCENLGIATAPKVGTYTEFSVDNRSLCLYRMPSTSRAYPLALEKKAAFYQQMFSDLELL